MSGLPTRADWPNIEAALYTATLAAVADRFHTSPGALAAAWREAHSAPDAGGDAAFADAEELPPEPGAETQADAPRVAWQVGHGPPGSRTYAVVVAPSAAEALAAASAAGVSPSSIARIGEVRD